jgi:hypothetical protein
MREIVEQYYKIVSFKIVQYQPQGFHYQSMVLQQEGGTAR